MDELDAALIRRAAMEYVRRYGSRAVEYLLDRAEISRGRGDFLSAQTWHDIAEVAAQILDQDS
jgi:hypothetical protein